MTPLFNDLNEALTYHLEGLYDAEKKMQKGLPYTAAHITNTTLQHECQQYIQNSQDKRLKLKRAFSYLLAGPFGRRDKVVDAMILELSAISKNNLSHEIKDAVLNCRLGSLVQYKISSYTAAIAFATVLELHAVADLLGEILNWEKETEQRLIKITLRINSTAAQAA